MATNQFNNWRSPVTGSQLELDDINKIYKDHEYNYKILNEIPDFIYPKKLNELDSKAKNFYEDRADDYDKYLHLTFDTYNEDELRVRNNMIDLLELKVTDKVLEIACGTGRDSELIAKKLGKKSELHLTDISLDMISTAKHKLENSKNNINYCLSNAIHLPYPDNYFDALYSFGAVGEFSDIKQFFKEVVRVCKTGAKVVVGDENLPVWQRNTLFGKILVNYNKQFLAEVPFDSLPIESREVRCQWIIGGVFYLIDFKVGEGEPYANFDFEIPGVRGGTHKTRYYGQLEGVTEEARELAEKARVKTGKSMHQWLDELVKKEAKKLLGIDNAPMD
ncbi:MAG: methyltransferase domain-containing protein [gamma proteobacterium symbiont of Taylorina sp.]|nr:methyltransferase domain-containing protein [gamma proteobacterium symbiont of Taylorina sp.]